MSSKKHSSEAEAVVDLGRKRVCTRSNIFALEPRFLAHVDCPCLTDGINLAERLVTSPKFINSLINNIDDEEKLSLAQVRDIVGQLKVQIRPITQTKDLSAYSCTQQDRGVNIIYLNPLMLLRFANEDDMMGDEGRVRRSIFVSIKIMHEFANIARFNMYGLLGPSKNEPDVEQTTVMLSNCKNESVFGDTVEVDVLGGICELYDATESGEAFSATDIIIYPKNMGQGGYLVLLPNCIAGDLEDFLPLRFKEQMEKSCEDTRSVLFSFDSKRSNDNHDGRGVRY